MLRTRVSALLLAGIVGVLSARPADAAVAVAVLGRYATPVSVTVVGGPLVLANAETASHNLVARMAKRPDGSAPFCSDYSSGDCPLFWSELIEAGTTMVEGLDEVEVGASYAFWCEIHQSMTGTLLVIDGEP
jgi:hypothetical protein